MNVLFISHESGPMSGSALSLYDMVVSLQRKGVECYVIMPKKCHAYTYFTGKGIKCFVISFKLNITSGDLGLKFYLKFIPRLVYDKLYNFFAIHRIVKIFKGKGIDIVHSNTGVFDIGPCVAKLLGAKHVWHLREFQDLDFNFRPFTGWSRLLKKIHSSDAVIAISKPIYEHFKCGECRVATYMFDAVVDDYSAKFIDAKHKKRQILFCGFICPAKRIEVALKIFQGLYVRQPDYKFVVVGKFASAQYQRDIEKLVRELNISKAVDIVGYVEDPSRFFDESQVLIMSSANEAQGRVTVEAMFHCCIVLGFNSGGTSYIIKDGYNGFLFDNETEGVSKLANICEHYDEESKLIKDAYDYSIKEFSISKYGDKIIHIYNEIRH